tara:strand:- start:4044 stop:4961 length:918 start_codon:yes stop_codon:yes gene_type:complete
MRIVLIGQAAFAKDTLSALIENKENVVGVFCPPDKDSSKPDPVKSLSLEHSINVLQFNRMRSEDAINAFKELEPDLCVMAFVTDIVPNQMLEYPKFGTIQYHPSLLPEHRGPSSINWPIIQGKKTTGLSIFWPDEGLDTGPILLQKKVSIEKDDTLGTLYFNKLYPIGIDAILESIDLIRSGKAPKKPQNHALATYEGWCKSDDVKIDWNADKNSVFDLIRGSDPSPGANTKFENHIVSLFDSQLQDQNPNLPPGTINLITDNSFSIAVRNGNIKVSRVKIDSGRKINSSDFIKDFNIIEGNSFI